MTHTKAKKPGPFPSYTSFLKINRTLNQAEQIYNQRILDAEEVFQKFSETFQIRHCPVCGDSKKRELTPFHDIYGVAECKTCLTQYVDPCPSLEALTYYYNECKSNGLFNDLVRNRHKSGHNILSDRVNFILKLIQNNFKDRDSINILEIGCGSGIFLSELKNQCSKTVQDINLIYTGIDIDRTAISKNVDPTLNLIATSAEDFATSSEQKFDLVLHFELIEHLQDPHTFMRSVRNLLTENGLQHFLTPNANGFDNRALGYNAFRPLAHGIFPPMHLQAFTPQNIMHFAIRSGFQLLQVDTPGEFDVDIVKTFLRHDDQDFDFIHEIPEPYLATFQHWLKVLCASSHMRVTLSI